MFFLTTVCFPQMCLVILCLFNELKGNKGEPNSSSPCFKKQAYKPLVCTGSYVLKYVHHDCSLVIQIFSMNFIFLLLFGS